MIAKCHCVASKQHDFTPANRELAALGNGNKKEAAEFQDKTYGVGNRVHTLGAKDKGKMFCTVCGHEKTATSDTTSTETKAAKKKK